jgi:hypothetical protein
MEKKNDSTILLLIAAGLGIYWFMKNKSLPPATTPVTTSDSSSTDVEIKSTQPVYNAPVTQTPTPEPTKGIIDIINPIINSGAKKDEAYQ